MSDISQDPNNIDASGSLVTEPTKRQLSGLQKFGVVGLIGVVLMGAIWLNVLTKAPKVLKQPDVALSSGGSFNPAPWVQPPDVTKVAAAMPMPPVGPLPPVFVQQPKQQNEMTPAQSPIFAFSGGAAVVPAVASELPGLPPGAAGGVPGSPNPLEARLKPTVLNGSKARLLPHPDMLITMGTTIPCILQTAIDTTLAGYVDCVMPHDVRSTTGNVTLLPRGTKVVGEIQNGLIQGQARVFVLWDRAETPDHAIIELSSPGADELGRSGVPGRLNEHWWARFGSAILLSVVQGTLQAGTALAGSSGSGTYFNSFQSNGSNIGNTALEASINIPPTLERDQGGTVNIFVAKDLDFSDVYDLHVTGVGYAK